MNGIQRPWPAQSTSTSHTRVGGAGMVAATRRSTLTEAFRLPDRARMRRRRRQCRRGRQSRRVTVAGESGPALREQSLEIGDPPVAIGELTTQPVQHVVDLRHGVAAQGHAEAQPAQVLAGQGSVARQVLAEDVPRRVGRHRPQPSCRDDGGDSERGHDDHRDEPLHTTDRATSELGRPAHALVAARAHVLHDVRESANGVRQRGRCSAGFPRGLHDRDCLLDVIGHPEQPEVAFVDAAVREHRWPTASRAGPASSRCRTAPPGTR